MRTSALLLLAAGMLPAQVYVVDVNNGPGTHFTSIAAAVAAIPDGAVLQVRAGFYGGFQVTGKSLAVLADPGVLVNDLMLPPIKVDSIAAGQTVVLRGLGIANALGPASFLCESSAGTILIDDGRADLSTSTFGGGVIADQCAQLHVRSCTFHATSVASCLDLTHCNTTVLGCSLTSPFGQPIRLLGGHLDVVGSDVRAGLTPPAISMGSADVVVRGASTLSGSGRSTPGFAVDGSGTLRIDPNATILNAPNPAFGAGVTVTTVAMPALYAWPAGPGGNASAVMFGPAGGIGALVVGFPGAPYAPSWLPELSWILPGTEVVNARGGATLTGGYAVPNAPWVLAVTVTWQGVTWAPGAGLQLSNAATGTH